MKKYFIIRYSFYLFLFVFITSCANHWPYSKENIVGDFTVSDAMGPWEMHYRGSLIFGKGLNDKNNNDILCALGNDSNYIIIETKKVHYLDSIGKYVPIYFIIDVKEYAKQYYYSENKGLLGPFSQQEFTQKKKQLGIENLAFKKEYHNN